MADLMNDTGVLLALEFPTDGDDKLQNVSRTTVMWIALEAKADAYNFRVTKALAAGANAGASMSQLCDAAGFSVEEVASRLAEHPELLNDIGRLRLPLPGHPSEPMAPIEDAPPVRTRTSRILDRLRFHR